MADGLFGGGGAAFGIYPQMGGRRTMQDPQASADIPADVLRGRIAGLLGAIPDFLNLKRSLLPAEAVQALESYGKIAPEVPYGSEYYLQNLPLAPTSQVGQLAGQVGSFVPLNPMPVVRGVQTVGRMMGERMAENVVTGRPNLPSMIAEPKASLLAVEPNPSMASAPVNEVRTGVIQASEGLPVGMSIKDVGKGITSNISQFTGFKNTTPYGKAKEVAAYLDRLNIPYTINKSKTTNSAYLEIQTGKNDFDYPMQFRFSDHSTDLPHQNRQIFTNPKPDPNFDLDVFKDGGHDTEFAVNKINELAAKINYTDPFGNTIGESIR